jgi:hypothetical protein
MPCCPVWVLAATQCAHSHSVRSQPHTREQVSYGIGLAEPLSVYVDTYGTGEGAVCGVWRVRARAAAAPTRE